MFVLRSGTSGPQPGLPMDADSAAVVFENADWTVSAVGLEHKRTGYFIESELLADRRPDGLWTWPLHMAEKLWCAPASFADAFSHALNAYAVESDAGLAGSFAAARGAHIAPARRGAAIEADEPAPARLGDLARAVLAPAPPAPPRNSGRVIRRAAAPARAKPELKPALERNDARTPAHPRPGRLDSPRSAARA